MLLNFHFIFSGIFYKIFNDNKIQFLCSCYLNDFLFIIDFFLE